MGSYIGIDGKARKIKTIYIGVNGKACKIKNAYIGDSNGKARLVHRGIIPYGSAMYDTPGTYTFTVPSGVTSVTATIVGGGGSGMGAGAYIDGVPHSETSRAFLSGSSAGGSSSFGSYTSTGGGYNYPAVSNRFPAVAGVVPERQKTVSKGGNPGGHDGNNTNAGSGFAVNNKTYGIGGGVNDPCAMGVCGGSGGYQKTTVAVTPGNKYSVIVGAGGKQCSAYGVTGYAGGNGCVFIEWGTK